MNNTLAQINHKQYPEHCVRQALQYYGSKTVSEVMTTLETLHPIKAWEMYSQACKRDHQQTVNLLCFQPE
jgi:hypothetical protein